MTYYDSQVRHFMCRYWKASTVVSNILAKLSFLQRMIFPRQTIDLIKLSLCSSVSSVFERLSNTFQSSHLATSVGGLELLQTRQFPMF